MLQRGNFVYGEPQAKKMAFPPAIEKNQQSTVSVSSGIATTPQSSISSSSADISVDFGNRQISTYPIPSTILGVGGVGLKLIVRNNSDANAISQANFHLTKLGDYDFMSQIFPTAASVNNPSQQNWSLFDNDMALAASYNMQPIISLEYTPTWLQPQNQSHPQANLCLQCLLIVRRSKLPQYRR